jgi:hypothetical protein
MGDIMPVQPDPTTVNLIAEQLTSSAFRKSFSVDPIGTLSRAGIDVSKVPREQLDILADLSPTELTILGNIAERVRATAPDLAAADRNGYLIF